jgi:hypothetical protein
MTLPERLTPAERSDILRLLPAGGDLISICNFAGVTQARLRLEMKRDPEFEKEVARTEASAELGHMGHIGKAAQDPKLWRSSAWWIERRSRLRAAGDGRALSEAHSIEMVDELALIIMDEVPKPAVHCRIIERMMAVIERHMGGNRPADEQPDQITVSITDIPFEESHS